MPVFIYEIRLPTTKQSCAVTFKQQRTGGRTSLPALVWLSGWCDRSFWPTCWARTLYVCQRAQRFFTPGLLRTNRLTAGRQAEDCRSAAGDLAPIRPGRTRMWAGWISAVFISSHDNIVVRLPNFGGACSEYQVIPVKSRTEGAGGASACPVHLY